MEKREIILIIAGIVLCVIVTIALISDKNKKSLKSLSIETLKLKLKTNRSLLILMFLCFSVYFYNSLCTIKVYSTLLLLPMLYIGILNFVLTKRILKEKLQEEEKEIKN